MEENDFKSQVIEKAKEIFKVYGYKKTTMEDIAKACHKSKGLIYHHYTSKEEIFKIILNIEIAQFLSELKKQIDNQNNIKGKFTCFFISFNSWVNNTANMYHKIIFEIFDYVGIIKKDFESFHNEIIDVLKNLLNEGVKNNKFSLFGDVEQTAASLLKMIVGFILTPIGQILNLNINTNADINRFIDIIFYGLSKR